MQQKYLLMRKIMPYLHRRIIYLYEGSCEVDNTRGLLKSQEPPTVPPVAPPLGPPNVYTYISQGLLL